MMPRLFWKLFFALWLSIMTFAVVVSWINQTVILRNTVTEPGIAFETNLNRFKAKLAKDLKQGGERQVKRTLRSLPRGMRNHIFLLDDQGNELLGRERMLGMQKKERQRVSSMKLRDAGGRVYTLLSAGRMPPRGLLEPGPRGVGMRLGVAAMISALVSLLLARYLAAPLGQLSRASRLLARGDLSARVGMPLDQRKDEFGQLALDMDHMAARLQESQRANQRLLRDVSHELRSPLARLRVALEIARNKDSDAVTAELNRIELESQRLETLVDEVLSLLREASGPQQLQIQYFDLAEMLADLVETVNYELGDTQAKIDLQAQSPLKLNGDRELLWRVFENLLRNAMIHSGRTDGIELTAQLSPTGEKGGMEVRVNVKDTGPGIAEAHLSRIFEPFYRIDEARARNRGGYSDGHGLGLAIAFSAVRRHGGSISASNRRSGGLNVEVVLPVNRSE